MVGSARREIRKLKYWGSGGRLVEGEPNGVIIAVMLLLVKCYDKK